jgi:hypothetical protein
MSTHAFKAIVLPALLVGTSRQPIDFSRLSDCAISPGDPKSGLKALALTGQALRFERPAPPSDYAAIPMRNPSRRNVPEALRPMLVRVFGDRYSVFHNLALAMALALEARWLQPHPFDFPRMEGFLRAHAERLGMDVRPWIDRDKKGDEKRGYFDVEVLNDDNWHDATPSRRQRYIGDRRRQDANAARALVEAVWSNQGAELRFNLLQSLRAGLSSADIPFLEGLAKDRAPRVRGGIFIGPAQRGGAEPRPQVDYGANHQARERHPAEAPDTKVGIAGDRDRGQLARTGRPVLRRCGIGGTGQCVGVAIH